MATLQELYKFNETTGTIEPADFAEVESVVKGDVCDALDVSHDVQMSTPMGRLLEWWSIFGTNVLGLNVQNANQLLVSAAAGQQLDAIAQWFQLARKSDSYTRVTVTCSGRGGTEIPAGSRVRSENGDTFEAMNGPETNGSWKIDGESGKVNVEFEALEIGAIPALKGTVNIVDATIDGWDACINDNDGVVGSDLETDESLRARIQAARTVAPGFIQAIKNAVEAALPGPASSFVVENNTGYHLAVHGVDMEPHSILVCVYGIATVAEAQAVAKAIFDTKPCGTGYTRIDQSATFKNADRTSTVTVNADGSVSSDFATADEYDVVVNDAYGNQYHVFFCKPIPLPITTTIAVQNRSYTGADLIGDVENAFTQWYGENNFGCGAPVYASEIIKAVEAAVPGVVVVECTVSDGGSYKGTSYVEVDAVHRAQFDTPEVTIFSR